MIYVFESEDGFRIERDFLPIEVPDEIVEEGVAYRALFGASPGQGGAPAMIVKDHSHLAHTAPRRWAGDLAKDYDKWNHLGVAVVEGAEDKRRLRDALKKSYPRQDWQYDP